jgi:serine/threonine protein kinase
MGKHPNIVELLGQDRVDHVMVMEQGSSDMYKLVKKMGTEKGVPEYMMASWAQGICAGVSHMHACGYVHQDLKSSNVLVFGDRTVRLRAGSFAFLVLGPAAADACNLFCVDVACDRLR